jgi:hypothetical protein
MLAVIPDAWSKLLLNFPILSLLFFATRRTHTPVGFGSAVFVSCE